MSLPDGPKKDDFIVHQADPVNAEPETGALLSDGLKTSRGHQYLRNHGEILHLPREGYELHLDVEAPLAHLMDPTAPLVRERLAGKISLDALRGVGETSLAAALQCAGNRREEMNDRQEVEGIQWRAGTILNADWEGVLLRDFLLRLGVPEDIEKLANLAKAHVHFMSKQECEQASEYEASIPLIDAMDERRRVMLATKMNQEALPDEHGGPLRVVVPGFVGARSVKWLHTLRIGVEPSTNFYMVNDYKKLPPSVGPADKAKWMKKIPPLQETGLQSSIGKVEQDGDALIVQGYALDGHGMAIREVQVCALPDIDTEGQEDLVKKSLESEWMAAKLEREETQASDKAWSWTLFSARVAMREAWRGKKVVVLCRAKTVDGKEQEAITDWNLRGVEVQGYGIYRDVYCE